MPFLSTHFDAFFSNDIARQLVVWSPLVILDLLWLALNVRLYVRRHRRPALGTLILMTLAAYAVFVAALFLLPITGTSYGAVQPIAVIFALLFGLALNIGLCAWLFVPPLRKGRRGALAYGLSTLAALGLLFYAFYIEPLWVDVTYTDVRLAKLPGGTPPIRVVLMSDTHIERWTRREDDVLAKLVEIKPDMIILAGDYLNIDHFEPEAYADLHRFFAGLHAPYGVYAVPGMTDHAGFGTTLDGTDVVLLDDTYKTVTVKGARLNLVGISDFGAQYDAPMLTTVDRTVPSGAPKFLIYHAPDLIHESAAAGYDFYFAGHTHGGQIALPFFGALVTFGRYGLAYKAGLYELGGSADTHMYITRGIGMEGMNSPRARFFARPEISVITFVPASP